MASPGQQATGTSPLTGGANASSPHSRFLSFLGNVFDSEMTPEENAALDVLKRCASIPFVGEKPEHEEMLQKLLELCFPEAKGQPLKKEDPRWKEIGFQSEDPRRDFRGGGLLALHNLCFFRVHAPEAFNALSAKSNAAGFPMAAALINVTHMLVGYLRLGEQVGLGAGELTASRRAARCFARLCLNCEDASTPEDPDVPTHAFSVSSVPEGLQGPQKPQDSCLSPKRLEAPFPHAAGEGHSQGTGVSSAPPGLLSEQRRGSCRPVSPRRFGASRRTSPQRVASARSVLNTFGRLFVFASIRVDKELSLKGAWEPDGVNPPLRSPGAHAHIHNLLHVKRHNNKDNCREYSESVSPAQGQTRSRRLSASVSPRHFPLGSRRSPKQQPQQQQLQQQQATHSTSPKEATQPLAGSSPRLEPPQAHVEESACCVPAACGAAPGPLGLSAAIAGLSEVSSENPKRNSESPAESVLPDASKKPSAKEKEEVTHRRAHLCFGEVLKETRNAVDALLSEGNVQELEAVFRCF